MTRRWDPGSGGGGVGEGGAKLLRRFRLGGVVDDHPPPQGPRSAQREADPPPLGALSSDPPPPGGGGDVGCPCGPPVVARVEGGTPHPWESCRGAPWAVACGVEGGGDRGPDLAGAPGDEGAGGVRGGGAWTPPPGPSDRRWWEGGTCRGVQAGMEVRYSGEPRRGSWGPRGGGGSEAGRGRRAPGWKKSGRAFKKRD